MEVKLFHELVNVGVGMRDGCSRLPVVDRSLEEQSSIKGRKWNRVIGGERMAEGTANNDDRQ